MASLQALLLAVFITAVALDQSFVEAKFSKSMYINWGAHHSTMSADGEDIQLVLDKTSGNKPVKYPNYKFTILFRLVPGA